MPSAVRLTPRADAEPDARLLALWIDKSSAVPPATAYWTEAPEPLEWPSAVFSSVDVTEGTSIGPPRMVELPSLAVPSSRIIVARPRLGPSDTGAVFAERFEALRQRLRLPVQKYARLLGTSRRTLYHWLETDRPQDFAVDRIDRLAEWVAELERHLTAAEIQRLLDPEAADSLGALLVDEGFDAAADRLRLLTEEAHRPRTARQLASLADDPTGEPPTSTPEELRAAFAAFATPRRPVRPPVKSEPPELTY